MNTLNELITGQLKGIRRLTLSCGLTHFPEEIFELSDSLEILDLPNNLLSQLPDNFAQLHRLKILFLTNNQFKTFPKVLSECPKLKMISFKHNQITQIPENAIPAQVRWLILTDNCISTLPRSIGECSSLEKFAIAGNVLTSLPEEMAACQNLALLRISANKLRELPDWLLRLPRLAWLAFSGNPFCKRSLETESFNEISWHDLEMRQTLGEGASGVISKAIWHQSENVDTEVAVKIFKGTVTSDGYAEDEMSACILSGEHPNLVRTFGRITNHPQPALVFELIPPTFHNLGLPPSLESCSRDTFNEGTHFTITEVTRIARAIASAMTHLHQRGIMHGDVYAHNTLIDGDANTFFGDFGAASLYAKDDASADALQRIDVRAYGYLLEDLLQRNCPTASETRLRSRLEGVSQRCLQPSVRNRPGFQEIGSILENGE
jgi:hypothetical protein